MRIVSYGPRYGERPGVMLNETQLLDLTIALPDNPASWRKILEDDLLDDVITAVGAVDHDPAHLVDLKSVRLAPPIPEPSKVICLGLNYRDHAEEQNRPLPTAPLLFPKVPSALIGQGESVVLPRGEAKVDYEVELAFVIGRRARNVTIHDAWDHVLGYTVMNDVSGRETQGAERQWLRAKGFETFGPMGPWIVTRDEIADPHNLEISSRINGELRQRSNTRELIFRVDFMVEYLSSNMTLEPGDVISTGTPGGVGLYCDPPVFLKNGDVMSMTIEGIGTLENMVVDPA
ncbi:MAG: fumarylacetoacetate hydrolase family protein [bacterium]|nr:fumarylacetoacetate hydrolase family protein [bacterium]